jgi:hypothetical protein
MRTEPAVCQFTLHHPPQPTDKAARAATGTDTRGATTRRRGRCATLIHPSGATLFGVPPRQLFFTSLSACGCLRTGCLRVVPRRGVPGHAPRRRPRRQPPTPPCCVCRQPSGLRSVARRGRRRVRSEPRHRAALLAGGNEGAARWLAPGGQHPFEWWWPGRR